MLSVGVSMAVSRTKQDWYSRHLQGCCESTRPPIFLSSSRENLPHADRHQLRIELHAALGIESQDLSFYFVNSRRLNCGQSWAVPSCRPRSIGCFLSFPLCLSFLLNKQRYVEVFPVHSRIGIIPFEHTPYLTRRLIFRVQSSLERRNHLKLFSLFQNNK